MGNSSSCACMDKLLPALKEKRDAQKTKDEEQRQMEELEQKAQNAGERKLKPVKPETNRKPKPRQQSGPPSSGGEDSGLEVELATQRALEEELDALEEADEIKEYAERVDAFVDNTELQSAFLKFAVDRKFSSSVDKLINYLRPLQEPSQQQRGNTGLPPSQITPVIQKMSTNPATRTEEAKALLVAAEAFKEFNSGAIKCIVELTDQKRTEVLKLIDAIPIGSSQHVFIQPCYPDSDQVYYKVLRKMGFGNNGFDQLQFSAEDDRMMEMYHAGLTAILASRQ